MTGFLITILMLFFGGVLGNWGINMISHHVQNIAYKASPAKKAFRDAILNQEKLMTLVSELLLPEVFSDGVKRGEYVKEFKEVVVRLGEGVRRYEGYVGGEEKRLWGEVRALGEELERGSTAWVTVVEGGNREEALRLWRDTLGLTVGRFGEVLGVLGKENDKKWELYAVSGLGQARWFRVAALVGTVFGVLFALVLGFYFSRAITVPLVRVTGELKETAGQFLEAASQIEIAGKVLSQSSREQLEGLDKVKGMLEELKEVNAQYVEGIRELKETADATGVSGMDAFNQMRQARKIMKDIKTSSENTAKYVRNIEDIAFQTRLLALNASVEAARSRGVGSGFAVVSADIRNLGRKSSQAAKNSLDQIKHTIEAVGGGADSMQVALKKFSDYGVVSFQIADFTKEASNVAVHLKEAVGEIASSMGRVGQITEKVAAEVKESASVASQTRERALLVKAQVERLAELVGV